MFNLCNSMGLGVNLINRFIFSLKIQNPFLRFIAESVFYPASQKSLNCAEQQTSYD